MQDVFDLNEFKLRLSETIAWCAPRVNPHDIKNTLWSLLPDIIHDAGYINYMRFCAPVCQMRTVLIEEFHNPYGRQTVSMPTLSPGLQAGRLLVYFAQYDTADGTAAAQTKYFSDVGDALPAWDTWVYFGGEVLNNESGLSLCPKNG